MGLGGIEFDYIQQALVYYFYSRITWW